VLNMIRDLRLKKGFTQEELAKKLGVEKVSVYNWEVGKVIPRRRHLQKLGEIFGVPVHDLLREISTDSKAVGSIVMKKIKVLRRMHGLSQKELAARVGVTVGAVSKWERGLSMPDGTHLRKLAEIFNIPVAEFFVESKSPAIRSNVEEASSEGMQFYRYPVLSTSVGAGIPFDISNVDEFVEDFVVLPVKIENAAVFHVKGNSMSGEGIKDGDFVLIAFDLPVRHGQIGLFQLNSSELLLRKFFVHRDGYIELRPANPEFSPLILSPKEQDIRDVRVIGRAIMTYKLLK